MQLITANMFCVIFFTFEKQENRVAPLQQRSEVTRGLSPRVSAILACLPQRKRQWVGIEPSRVAVVNILMQLHGDYLPLKAQGTSFP